MRTMPRYLCRLALNATVPGTYAHLSLGVASVGQFVLGRLVDTPTGRRSGLPRELLRLVEAISVGLGLASIRATLCGGMLLALSAAGTAWTAQASALATSMPPLMRGASPDGSVARSA